MNAPRETRLKALEARRHLREWQRFTARTWQPPETLPAAIAKSREENPAYISLDEAVDLLAFGLNVRSADPIEYGARRRQAYQAISRAARDKKFKAVRGQSAEKISAAEFKFATGLGREPSSVETTAGVPWLDVQIKAPRFFDWLSENCRPTIDRPGRPPQTFTPYPEIDPGLSKKVCATLETLKLIWPLGSPNDLSAPQMATKATAKFKARGRTVLDGRGRPIVKITEDDIKRALNRKARKVE